MAYGIEKLIDDYSDNLIRVLQDEKPENIATLCKSLKVCKDNNKQVFICGNGGSAANATHIANDFMYIDGVFDSSVRVESLTSNNAIMSCVANDLCYGDVFSKQLEVKADSGDVLLALSGSGNSENIIKAIEYGNAIGMETFAILGFNGGTCKSIAKHPIHFSVDDMQVSEDLQLIVGHICMKYLKSS